MRPNMYIRFTDGVRLVVAAEEWAPHLTIYHGPHGPLMKEGPQDGLQMEGPHDALHMEGPQDALQMGGPQDALHMEGPQDALQMEGPHDALHMEGPQDALQMGGPMASLLEILAHSINFTYSVSRPADGSWGLLHDNGSWSGMVGMVARKEADMALGPFAMTAARAADTDFCLPFFTDFSRMLAAGGRPEVDPWGFLLPLAPQVWAATLAALVLVVLAVIILSNIAARTPGLAAHICFTYYSVLLQQAGVSTRRTWERLAAGGWIVAALILSWSFCTNLTSILAVRYIPQPFQTFLDLIRDHHAAIVIERGTAENQFLMSATSGTLYDLARLALEGRLKYYQSEDLASVLHGMTEGQHNVLLIEDLSAQLSMADHFSRTGNSRNLNLILKSK
nr:glutamate receptor ionotropic, kainate glr-3-like [Procambarus clarkii]